MSQTPNYYLDKIIKSIDKDDYDDALKNCEKGLQAHPQNIPLLAEGIKLNKRLNNIRKTLMNSIQLMDLIQGNEKQHKFQENELERFQLTEIECSELQGYYEHCMKRTTILIQELEQKFNKDNQQVKELVATLQKKYNACEQFLQSQQESQKEEREAEAKQVIDMNLQLENQNYLKQIGFVVYLIPIYWYKQWRQYTNYKQVLKKIKQEQRNKEQQNVNQDREGAHGDSDDENDQDSNGSLSDKTDVDLDEDQCELGLSMSHHPGEIQGQLLIEELSIPDQFLEKEVSILQLEDPDSVQNYTNLFLQQNMKDCKDYKIFAQRIGKYLYGRYGGDIVRRYITTGDGDEIDQPQIEINLKRINFAILPNILESKDIKVFSQLISERESLKDLKLKISRSLRVYFQKNVTDEQLKANLMLILRQFKVWIMDARENIRKIYKAYNQGGLIEEDFQLTEKPDSTYIEELDISQEDLLIVEFQWPSEYRLNMRKIQEEKLQQIEEEKKLKCACCGKKKPELYFCQCLQIKYCDHICQKNHRSEHKEECHNAVEENQSQEDLLKQYASNKDFSKSKKGRNGVTGLQNLGNTCFMNSALQCLSNVNELTNFFISDEFIKDINTQNPLGQKGQVATVYGQLMKELWLGQQSYVSPWDLKQLIGKVAPQFSGFSQQDSQELLSYLLDSLSEDINRIQKQPSVNTKDCDGGTQEEIIQVADQSWTNYQKRNDSQIVDLMVGQFQSTLDCPNCQQRSITFDPFMSVSLPLPSLQKVELQYYIIFHNASQFPYQVKQSFMGSTPSETLIEIISKETNIPLDNLQLTFIEDHQIVSLVNSSSNLKSLSEDKRSLFVFEVPFIEQSGKRISEIPDKKQKILHIFLLFYLQVRRTGDKDLISYSRLLQVSGKTTFQKVHHKVYQIFRIFYLNYQQKMDENREKYQHSHINITAKLEQDSNQDVLSDSAKLKSDRDVRRNPVIIIDEKELEREYQKWMEIQQENRPFFYTLQIHNSNTQYQFPYNDIPLEEKLQKSSFLEIEMVLSSQMPQQYLKFNRCTDAPFSESSKSGISRDRDSNLYNCLDLFINKERLDQGNQWYCNKCQDHVCADQKMEIYKAPRILILHMKRFRTSNVRNYGNYYYTSGGQKLGESIDYPITGLDMTKYVIGQKPDEVYIYDLFAVSNHYGSMAGGHYTAYAFNSIKQQWYQFNDSSVSAVSDTKEIVSSAGYVLFYRRREQKL